MFNLNKEPYATIFYLATVTYSQQPNRMHFTNEQI